MPWFWQHRYVEPFTPPPCMCDEIEKRVAAAIAMRDEMAKWPTPIEAWVKLQQMPVLRLKSEQVKPAPKPAWVEAAVTLSTYMATAPKQPPPAPARRHAPEDLKTMQAPVGDGKGGFIFRVGTASVPHIDVGRFVYSHGRTYQILSISHEYDTVVLKTMVVG